MNFMYKFPAVRGVQANIEYYISMVPMKLLPKLFVNTEEIVSPEYRAQRRLNEQRIPEIGNYIIQNRNSYVFSALSASIDGGFKFTPTSTQDDNLGLLEIDMDAKLLINDGQHRRAAIAYAINEDATLGSETISIVFFKDQGLAKSQQMFTDLNKHAVKTSNSISTFFDSRDPLAIITKDLINKIEFFKRFVDKEKDILGKNSSSLFTLTNLYKSNQKIIRGKSATEKDAEFLLKYWQLVCNNITEWQDVLSKQLTKKDLREQYVVTLAVVIMALGCLGSYFYENRKLNMETYLKRLGKVDWKRDSVNWKDSIIGVGGKILNNQDAINAAFRKIKDLLQIK